MVKRCIRRVLVGLINLIGSLALLGLMAIAFYGICLVLSSLTTFLVNIMNKIVIRIVGIFTTDIKNIIVVSVIIILSLIVFVIFKELVFHVRNKKRNSNKEKKHKYENEDEEENTDEYELDV